MKKNNFMVLILVESNLVWSFYSRVSAIPELLNIVESAIFTFHDLLKRDKNKSYISMNLFKGHKHDASSLQQVQASLDKRGQTFCLTF
ncbi:hypothetical protein KFK09_003689 [Dendrobium nobile]|uniref:Uncharacterized protein n=1 Tax=Dendrobium nobile TaxID=94219 RepID=A0A8T3C0U2_DENNO|nr:hypothetical protein KFK09_003689 [Dendrobium nobile]